MEDPKLRRFNDDPDYGEYLELQRELEREYETERLNTPVGRFAPADFEYDPLSKRGFE